MPNNNTFLDRLKDEFERLQAVESSRFSDIDTIRVDIHCHDYNSDIPDERMARILRWPETWTSTEEVHSCIKKNNAIPLTMTNHNNARTCFELLDKGEDQLVGAEFTCDMPNFDIKLHVLVYGFNPSEETELNKRRKSLYKFLEFARERNLVTVLAHPLFVYHNQTQPRFQYLERLMLLFDNIEVWNGQRDAWQNILAAKYVSSLNEESITEISKRERFSPLAFCESPYNKRMTGGSDCHMALFAGSSGTRFFISNLIERQKDHPLSSLVLESFRKGDFAWYGSFASEIKLTAALLDFFCQAVQNSEDPGLLRLMLHKGTANEKLAALAIINGIAELKRHKYTSRFLSTLHGALHGTRPGFLLRKIASKKHRHFIAELDKIATASISGGPAFINALETEILELMKGFLAELSDKAEKNFASANFSNICQSGLAELLYNIECPSVLRNLISSTKEDDATPNHSSWLDILDGLPFPALAALFFGAAQFSGAKVMHENRELLNEVAKEIGELEHPKRVLWLTDTFSDQNGVSVSLQDMLKEIRRRGLPIDIAAVTSDNCTNFDIMEETQNKTKKNPSCTFEDSHFITVPPISIFVSGIYPSQPIRLPDITFLHKILSQKRYDRIVCSTEGPMGLVALYLKESFSVPTFFYMHTDWMDFSARTLSLEPQGIDRLRRLLRAYYKKFDGIFVLNDDHYAFLKSDHIGIEKERIFKTAHWPRSVFMPKLTSKSKIFPNTDEETPVLLFVGRISEEKGIDDLVRIYRSIRKAIPNTVLAIAGEGPEMNRLRNNIPEAFYSGWVDEATLVDMYTASDLLLLPSRFDTFGNVVLEAHACGLPVAAYNTKGPKDIIFNGKTGFLVETEEEMAQSAIKLLTDSALKNKMKQNALLRASDYNAENILTDLMSQLGLAGLADPQRLPISPIA